MMCTARHTVLELLLSLEGSACSHVTDHVARRAADSAAILISHSAVPCPWLRALILWDFGLSARRLHLFQLSPTFAIDMLHIMCAALLGTVQVITLPPDIVPHGLALLANGTLFFATADATPLHRLDLSTGAISLLEASVERRKAWGLLSMEDLGLVALASGPGGELDLYDFSGAKVSTTYLPVHSDTLPTGQVAHVARLGDSLYLTNAVSNVLYRVLISDAAANAGHHHTIPITGPLNFDHTASLFFNAHGIVATPDQKALLVAASYQQRIFRVDPNTGDSMDVQLTDKDGKAPYLEYPYGEHLARAGPELRTARASRQARLRDPA